MRFGVGSGEGLPLRRGRVLWKKRRERIRWRRVGFCGLGWDVNVKDVEDLALREGPEVIVRRVREWRGVFMGLERWKADRMVVGSLAAPRAPSNVVRSIFGVWRGSRFIDNLGPEGDVWTVQIQGLQLADRTLPQKSPRSPSRRSMDLKKAMLGPHPFYPLKSIALAVQNVLLSSSLRLCVDPNPQILL